MRTRSKPRTHGWGCWSRPCACTTPPSSRPARSPSLLSSFFLIHFPMFHSSHRPWSSCHHSHPQPIAPIQHAVSYSQPATAEELEERARLDSQLRIGVERVRAVELLFQPSLRGADHAGLGQVIASVARTTLGRCPGAPLAVFLTGGLAKIPGFQVDFRFVVFGSVFSLFQGSC
jgi:hypothetical protein